MLLCKSFRILRRSLNTVASGSKTNGSGQSVSKANLQSVNHGQQIPDRLADIRDLFNMAETSLAVVLGATFGYLIEQSLTKYDLEAMKREGLKDLNRKSKERQDEIKEEFKMKEQELDKEIMLMMEKIKEEGRRSGWSI